MADTAQIRIEPDKLMEAACEKTGLNDFGGNSFRQGLDIFCEATASEAQLNDFGAMALPGAITNALSNRLKVVDWVKRHPEVSEERIEAPTIVVGMFRAGTTFLSYLLEKDARHRPLFRWEAGDSVPPPTPQGIANDPRIAATRAAMEMMDTINPRMRVVQSEEPDGPTECISVMNQDFKSLTWEAMVNVPTYANWLKGVDHSPAYDYHKTVLQVLQSGGVRGRWSLKAPYHIIHLNALTAVYPDARLVVTHRDPVVLASSVCSLITALTGLFSDADHKAFIADHWVEMLARSIDGLNSFRDANPHIPIVDVQYSDLARDPLGTLRSVYTAFGDDIGGQPIHAMTAHVESHPKHRFGRHGYKPAEYGLDAGAIAERFRPYVERYGIELEKAAP